MYFQLLLRVCLYLLFSLYCTHVARALHSTSTIDAYLHLGNAPGTVKAVIGTHHVSVFVHQAFAHAAGPYQHDSRHQEEKAHLMKRLSEDQKAGNP